jgi:hypothetical protein
LLPLPLRLRLQTDAANRKKHEDPTQYTDLTPDDDTNPFGAVADPTNPFGAAMGAGDGSGGGGPIDDPTNPFSDATASNPFADGGGGGGGGGDSTAPASSFGGIESSQDMLRKQMEEFKARQALPEVINAGKADETDRKIQAFESAKSTFLAKQKKREEANRYESSGYVCGPWEAHAVVILTLSGVCCVMLRFRTNLGPFDV